MKLYYMPGACSRASYIALIWAGSDYQLVRLTHDTVHEPDFLRLNPKGAVPALIISYQQVLTESLAICCTSLTVIRRRTSEPQKGMLGEVRV